MQQRWRRLLGGLALALLAFATPTPTILALSAPTARDSAIRHILDSTNRRNPESASVGDPDPHDQATPTPRPSTPTSRIPSPVHNRRSSVPEWLRRSKTLGVLTSSENPTPSDGDGLVDGVIVRIADRFALTYTSLLSQRGLQRLRNATATHAVIFSGDASRVKRVEFQFESNDPSLIVLELVDSKLDTPVVSIVTAPPVKNYEFEQLRIVDIGSVLDTKALEMDSVPGRTVKAPQLPELRDLTFLLEPLCGYQTPTDGNEQLAVELCVGRVPSQVFQSPQEEWKKKKQQQPPPKAGGGDDGRHLKPSRHNSSSHNASTNSSTPVHTVNTGPQPPTTAALLLYNDQLVGFSIPTKAPRVPWASTMTDKQGFLRLAAPKHQQFIDDATQATASFSTADVFSQEAKYPSYLVSFTATNGSKLACQGVLIAPRFVLTTASCVTSSATTAIRHTVFYSGVKVGVVADHIATHPRYTAGDATFDTAVVELETDVAFAPIQLDDGSCDVASEALARVRFNADRFEVAALAPSLGSNGGCKGPNGGSLRESEAVCVAPVPLAQSRFTPQDVVGGTAIAAYVVQTTHVNGAALVSLSGPSGLALVGLGVSPLANSRRLEEEDDDAGSAEVYVRVANSATFINAYVTGQSWSKSTSASIFNSEMSAAVVVIEQDSETELLPVNQGFVVGLRSTADGQNYCGGSLIAPAFVLTAAHCVVDGPPNFVSIGAVASSGVENEVIEVVKTQLHPQYATPHRFSFDVAVLELAFASASRPVKLGTTADFTHKKQTATMYGYGMASASSGLSPTLRAVAMPLWSAAACAALFKDEVDGSMLCAGGEKGKDACTGDSGSPLAVALPDGTSVLVGVVSAGAGCGTEFVPGLYARVQSLRAFVGSYVVGAEWTSAVAGEGSGSSGNGGGGGGVGSSSIEPRDAAEEERDMGDLSTSGGYNMAQVALAELSPLVRDALMDFLLGREAGSMVTAEMLRLLRDSGNVLKFFSTGDLTALVAVVRRHDKAALNGRRDRFGRWASGYAAAAAGQPQCVDAR